MKEKLLEHNAMNVANTSSKTTSYFILIESFTA